MLAWAERIYIILACFACWVNLDISPFKQQVADNKVDQYLDTQLLENHFDGEVLAVTSGGTILVKTEISAAWRA